MNQNKREAWQALLRDRQQRDDLIQRQLEEHRALQLNIKNVRQDRHKEIDHLKTMMFSALPPENEIPASRTIRTATVTKWVNASPEQRLRPVHVTTERKESVNARFKFYFYRITECTGVILDGSQSWRHIRVQAFQA